MEVSKTLANFFEADDQAKGFTSMEVKKTLFWYLIGTAGVFCLMALGVTSEPPHTYYNPTDTTPWWSPIIVVAAALVTLIVPLPHVLIASLFRRKRNWVSLSKIIRGWHIGLVVAIIALGLIGLINKYSTNFCTSVLAIEGNQKALEDFYKNDAEHFEGNSVKYGREAEPYKTYSRCVNVNTQNECWSKLVGTDAITYRERIELAVSVGVVLHECQLKMKDAK